MPQKTKQSIRLGILADYAEYVIREYTDLIATGRPEDFENLAHGLQGIMIELSLLERTAFNMIADAEREDTQF